MENNFEFSKSNQQNEMPYKLPNATVGLILSIGSLFLCCFYGLGIITSAIALFLLNKDKKMLNQNSNVTNKSTYSAAVAISWIMLIINVIYLIFCIWLISKIGFENLNNPELLQDPDFINDIFGR